MKLLNRYFEKYALIIFGVITLIYALFLKQPFCDETHAYDIACLSFGEIFQITRIEGHTFLWYYILKPFCALNLFPYSMIFVNWAFCMGALYVLWKKAPFSTFASARISSSIGSKTTNNTVGDIKHPNTKLAAKNAMINDHPPLFANLLETKYSAILLIKGVLLIA